MTLHRALTGVHTRYINKVAARLAGRRGSLANLEHVGRTTGAVRHTPLRAFRTGDTVVIGLNFGRESDWLKNIAAAATSTGAYFEAKPIPRRLSARELDPQLQERAWQLGCQLVAEARTRSRAG